jgi:hypothetical protein
MRMVGIDRYIEIFEDEELAVAAFNEPGPNNDF